MTNFRSSESDYYPGEVKDAIPPHQPTPWVTAPLPGETSGRPDRPTVNPTVQGLPWVVSLFVFLLMLTFFLPYTVEKMTYAVARGRQRAAYDTAGDNLKDLALSDLSKACQLVARRVGPSVVHIDVAPVSIDDLSGYPHRSLRQHPTTGQGSGVVMDPDGYIVTNEHVVRGAREIRVKLSDGQVVQAEIVGVDRPTDVAVLKVDESNLMAAEWGDSDALDVGALVWALGSPFGLEHSVTFGILSAKHRSGIRSGDLPLESIETPYQDFLQTDAAVNPGNSGGPLVNSKGLVVGINTAIVGESYQGISFSVPSSVAKQIYERIREEGRVRRAWLGVKPREITPELAVELGLPDRKGAYVIEVPPTISGQPSPAQEAGIQAGDVIRRWDNQPVESRADLFALVAMTKIGSTVEVEVLRSGESLKLPVTVSERNRSH
jgi:serine protease Do